MPPAAQRNHGLDTLRACAIVLVIMTHYAGFVSGVPTFGMLGDIGWVGVDLFFALSGYLIGNQIFAALRSERGLSLPHFYARRLLRTLPNFYVVVALYFLWPWFRAKPEMLPLWKFLTFTQNYQLTPGTAFSHAWSLCIEEQFYMLLPALAMLAAARRWAIRWGWLLLLAAVGAGLLLRASLWEPADMTDAGAVHFYRNIYYSSFCRVDELLAGVALAMLKNYHGGLWRRLTAWGNLTLVLGVACSAATFALFLNDHYGYWPTVLGYPLLALSFALLILAALSERSLLRTVRVPGAAQMALCSYAIYLTHKQVLILAGRELRQYGWDVDALPAVLLLTGLTVVIGSILYATVEMPFMRLRDRYFPSNAGWPAAVALMGSPR